MLGEELLHIPSFSTRKRSMESESVKKNIFMLWQRNITNAVHLNQSTCMPVLKIHIDTFTFSPLILSSSFKSVVIFASPKKLSLLPASATSCPQHQRASWRSPSPKRRSPRRWTAGWSCWRRVWSTWTWAQRMMTMAACTGRGRGQKRWESILFVSCFENPHLQGSGQVEPACVCADASVEQSRPDEWWQGWQERGIQRVQQVAPDQEIWPLN